MFDPATRDAVVIDPVLDYELTTGAVFTDSVDRVTEFLQRERLALRMILETHAHADHLSGSQVLRARFPGAPVAIGERIREVQGVFKGLYALGDEFSPDGWHPSLQVNIRGGRLPTAERRGPDLPRRSPDRRAHLT